MPVPEVPAVPDLFKLIFTSSEQFVSHANIKISLESIDQFLDEIFADKLERYSKMSKGFEFMFPLNFDNDVEELNLIGLIALLDFDAAYDSVLYESTGRGATDAVRAFVFSLYLSATTGQDDASSLLTAQGMRDATPSLVASQMRLSIHVEKPHPTIPAITVGEQGGPLLPFVLRVTEVLRETGERLAQSNYSSLGLFIVEGLQSAKGDPWIGIHETVSRLVRAFPTFRGDAGRVMNQEIYTYRKAILLVLMIPTRFKLVYIEENTAVAAKIPAAAHAAMATGLLRRGILDVSECYLGSLQGLNNITQAPVSITSDNNAALVDDQCRPPKTEVPPTFIAIDADAVQALYSTSIQACNLIVQRAQAREDMLAEGWNGSRVPISSVGLSAYMSGGDQHSSPLLVAREP